MAKQNCWEYTGCGREPGGQANELGVCPTAVEERHIGINLLLGTYLPIDRCQAIALDCALPDRTEGSALFADISGFTPLTEAMARTLGPRRGAEELTRSLNRVYDTLIALVHSYGGSVLNFAGDAITCWFDVGTGRQGASEQVDTERPAGRATACALAMQAAMQAFAQVVIPSGETVTLAIKVAIASGPARRWAVGDANIQVLDVLAGATLTRMAAAEHMANRGEVVIDEATLQAGPGVDIIEWRTDEAGQRFAVIGGLPSPVVHTAWAHPALAALTAEQAKNWLLPVVYARLQTGAGEFLTELRPAVAMFIKFTGIDYDMEDDAGHKLDAYIQWVQRVLARYDGFLLGITMGDKGSYLYTSFGALTAHEDDVRRAMLAALELCALPTHLTFIGPPHIGVSQGVLRVGAYGGTTRRTYGAIGDDTNLAARLMQAAQPGQVVISERVQQALKSAFICKALPPQRVKGKTEPVSAWALVGIGQRPEHDLHEPAYALPMVGREPELALVADKLALALQGHGQIVGITGEAGMGKSRLAAEIIQLVAKTKPLAGRAIRISAGACQSYGTHIPYLAWRTIWHDLFGLDPTATAPEQIARLEQVLGQINPLLVGRMPLLGLVLELPIPDNDLTQAFDAKLRKESLEALLVDCLKVLSANHPLVLVLEDLHWLDPLSHDLLEAIGRVVADLPVLIVLAYRPPELARLQAARVMGLPHATELRLREFAPAEVEQFIRFKLHIAQLDPEAQAALDKLTAQLQQRSQGNPFYIEELLNYMRDKGLTWQAVDNLANLDLPDSLHALVLSRMDQLAEREKMLLKVASVIGRVFSLAWLHGYYPALGDRDQIKLDLDKLHRLDITPLDTPEPELAYLFKHIVTQEVAYMSMPHAMQAALHEQLAHWLEVTLSALGVPPLDLLAYHFGRSENVAKKREYLQKAGEAAQAAFANEAALECFARLIPLLDDPRARIDLYLKRGDLLGLMGQWLEAEADYRAALRISERVAEAAGVARCQRALGRLFGLRCDYLAALAWLEQARSTFVALDDRKELTLTLLELGAIGWRWTEYVHARQDVEEALGLARALADKPSIAQSLLVLGGLAYLEGNHAAARALWEESLALKRELNHKWGISALLNNLGILAQEQGDYAAARALYEEGQVLFQEIGDKWEFAVAFVNLGNLALDQGDPALAQARYAESLLLCRELGDKRNMVFALSGLAAVAAYRADLPRAARLVATAETLRLSTGAAWEPAEGHIYERAVAAARAGLSEAEFNTAWAEGEKMTLDEALLEATQSTTYRLEGGSLVGD